MSATTATSHTKEFSQPNNWEKNTQPFTDDELINAYQLGKKTGMTEQARILSRTFEQNVNKAQSYCEKLYNSLIAKGYKLYTIHLRAESISTFSALFIVDKAQYLSDEFREAFVLSRNFQESIISDDFHIIFMFMAHSKTINEDCLNADGYFLKYEKGPTTTATRTA